MVETEKRRIGMISELGELVRLETEGMRSGASPNGHLKRADATAPRGPPASTHGLARYGDGRVTYDPKEHYFLPIVRYDADLNQGHWTGHVPQVKDIHVLVEDMAGPKRESEGRYKVTFLRIPIGWYPRFTTEGFRPEKYFALNGKHNLTLKLRDTNHHNE